jgi:hypothetical protein
MQAPCVTKQRKQYLMSAHTLLRMSEVTVTVPTVIVL